MVLAPHAAERPLPLGLRLLAGWLIFIAALVAATTLGEWAEARLGLSRAARQGVQALVVLATVPPLIWALRRHGDRRPWSGLRLTGPALAGPALARGGLLVVGLAAAALVVGAALGWLRPIALNWSLALLPALALEVALALAYEALPEELVFRGYLYRNLHAALPRWLAVLAAVGLFVLAPVAAVGVQTALGGTVRVGPAQSGGITADYIVLLATFGAVLQLCRIVTDNLWASVGFHLTWLSLGPLIVGSGELSLIRVTDLAAQATDLLVFFAGPIVGGLLALLAFSFLRRPPIAWRARCPDTDDHART